MRNVKGQSLIPFIESLRDIISREKILELIIKDLKKDQGNNLLSIYGIGSYFDSNLPSDWIQNDIDIIAIVNSLNPIPKQDWTEVRFEKRKIEEIDVWIGFNTIEGLQEKNRFQLESFANYEWSLIDLKFSKNSKLLYGKNIRDQLPNIEEIEFDYDDILIRSFYHLEKSLKKTRDSRDALKSFMEFTKAVFKFGFYLCVFLDNHYRLTSITATAKKLENFLIIEKIDKKVLDFFMEAINFRRKSQFGKDFKILRTNFIIYTSTLFIKGNLHRKMSFEELKIFLVSRFNQFPLLINFLNKVKKKYYQSKLKIDEN